MAISNRLRTAALELATQHALALLPVYAVKRGVCTCHRVDNCPSPGKHPASPHGYKDASADRLAVENFWRRRGDANIGIATGKLSNILVLDIDPRNGGNETMTELEAALGALPTTVTVNTGGGGRHLVFRYPALAIQKDTAGKRLGSGVDVLSDGGMMIAPPSRHASGKRYQWALGKSFDDIAVAKLPQSWLDRLTAANVPTPTPEVKGAPVAPAADAKIKAGQRNRALTSVAGALRHYGADKSTLDAALAAFNESRCEPPLGADEVANIVRSIASYPVRLIDEDPAERMATLVLAQHFENGRTLLRGHDHRFWHYSGKRWEIAPKDWLNGRILKTISDAPRIRGISTDSLIRQVHTILAAKLSSQTDLLAIANEPKRVLNCANGEVWIKDNGDVDFKPHRAESYLRQFVDVEYNPQAKCPIYDRALRQIFSNSGDAKRMMRFWNELVGYLIQPSRNIPVIVVLLGSGANGKTMLSRILIALLGSDQVMSQPVESLSGNRFALGGLFGKRLFLDDDVKAGARLPDGVLKTISEQKQITGEKKYADAFTFMSGVVPLLLCNNVPSLADVSDGMLRRLMIVPFDKRFRGSERDPLLLNRILADELPGVLNRPLAGYKRLAKRGRFKIPKPGLRAKKNWLNQANPLPAFVNEMCDKAGTGILLQDLYSAYRNWAIAAGFTITQSKLSFRRNLEHLGFRMKKGNAGLRVLSLSLR